jgi:hypothetical protein
VRAAIIAREGVYLIDDDGAHVREETARRRARR